MRGALKRVWFDITEDGTFGLMSEPGPNYKFEPFPKAMYHPTLEPKLIKTKTALDKLGKEWSDKPIRPQDQDKREPQDDD